LKALERIGLMAAFLLGACSDTSRFTTVSLSLDSIPDDVSSISIFVQDLDSATQVASTTVSAPQTSVLLGVPAEVPLLFTAVAYTQDPGPPPLKNMPAFVARNFRSVPLDRERIHIPLRAHRAGVLTTRIVAPDGESSFPEDHSLVLTAEQSSIPLPLLDLASESDAFVAFFVLPAGRYRARLVSKEGEDNSLRFENGEGLFVANRIETISTLKIIAKEDPILLTPPPKLKIELRDVQGATVADGFRLAVATTYQLRIVMDSASASTVNLLTAGWAISSYPLATLVGPSNETAGRFTDLSAPTLNLTTLQSGRAELNCVFEFSDGQTLNLRENFVVLDSGQAQGLPSVLRLSFVDKDALSTGTELRIELLDAQGLYARPTTGNISLGESDDWAFFQEGPSLDLLDFHQGLIFRKMARPSGPRGLPVVLRATLTSTNLPMSITSTLALPLLDF
jgi:hypothetical protein